MKIRLWVADKFISHLTIPLLYTYMYTRTRVAFTLTGDESWWPNASESCESHQLSSFLVPVWPVNSHWTRLEKTLTQILAANPRLSSVLIIVVIVKFETYHVTSFQVNSSKPVGFSIQVLKTVRNCSLPLLYWTASFLNCLYVLAVVGLEENYLRCKSQKITWLYNKSGFCVSGRNSTWSWVEGSEPMPESF